MDDNKGALDEFDDSALTAEDRLNENLKSIKLFKPMARYFETDVIYYTLLCYLSNPVMLFTIRCNVIYNTPHFYFSYPAYIIYYTLLHYLGYPVTLFIIFCYVIYNTLLGYVIYHLLQSYNYSGTISSL